MIKQIKNKLSRKNKKGFTLIELIVVIAIVAVLAAVGIPAIAGQVAKSQQTSADSNAKILAEQAQIMLTQAEAAGKVAAGTASCTIDATAFGGTGTFTVAVTPSTNDTDFVTAVQEGSNVKHKTTAPIIKLVGISDGTNVVGAKVGAVKFVAVNDKTEGYYPDKATFDALT